MGSVSKTGAQTRIEKGCFGKGVEGTVLERGLEASAN
jgi:hypothetical protein